MSTPAARTARRVEHDRSPLLGVPRRLVSLLWLPIVLFLLFWSPAQQVSPTWLYAGLVPAVAGWVVFALHRSMPPVATILTSIALAGGGIALLAGSDGWTTSAAFPMMAVFVAALRLPYRTALFVDVPGDYVKKPMQECTGEEITREWLYHLGVPVEEIDALAATGAKTVPVMMPYVTSFFMPRKAGDRPDVVPAGATNFAFIGQFAETGRDCIFTTEYSVRTGMDATYQLFGVERGVPEVFNSTYDVRTLLDASARLKDGEKTELPGPAVLRRKIAKGLDSTEIGVLLREHGIL